MQACKSFVILLFTVLLSGCEINQRPPSAELLEAQSRGIAQGERLAELEYMNRQAAVYTGCTFLVNLCPESITATGRNYLENNNSGGGGDSWVYWTVVSSKFIVLGVLLGALWAAIVYGWNKLVYPARSDLQRARSEIQTANEQAEQILLNARQEAENIIRDIEKAREHVYTQVSDLEVQKARLEQQIETLTSQAEEAKNKAEMATEELNRIKLARQAAANFD
jgi:outer membrane murein-binding lipoprotein Lpp